MLAAAAALALVFPFLPLLAQAPQGAAGVTKPLPPRPHVVASRTATPPVIDGRLDDPAWLTAIPSGGFVQHFPDEGAPPTENTEVRILYDDLNLYVGVDCEQLHSPIVKRLQRRDGQLPSDGVWIDIDSRRSGTGAFHFSINAAGSLSDGIHFNDTDYSADFDAVWEAKVADTGRGYSIEFRIPLSALRFSALPVQSWGFEVRRFIDARQETDEWAFYPRSATLFIPLFGTIDNLVDLKPRHPIELRPFVLGRVGNRAAGPTASASAGLDAKAHVTSELTLDLTFNPDFGQVDADTVILNLSTFETFFPEKRPFFLEGIDTFAAIRPLFYTRRIGKLPAPPALGADEMQVTSAEPSTIWGAAKLSGTIGGRTTLGLVSALVGASEVEVQQSLGPRVRRVLDPWTSYNILRLKRRIGNRAEVGLLATATNRFETRVAAGGLCAATGRAPGPDGRCTNDAYVASLDGRWRSASGDYGASWQAVGTTLQGGAARPQRDGIPITPGPISGGASLYLGKDGGPHWLATAWQYLTGRQQEFNDVGYLERKNDYQGYFTLSYRTLEPWWRTVETKTNLQLNLRETLGGLNLWNEVKLSSVWTFNNFWWVYLAAFARGAFYDDREMGDGAALERAGSLGLYLDMGTDPRQRVYVTLTGSAERRTNGMHLDATTSITVRALARLELYLAPTASVDTGSPRYVSTEARCPWPVPPGPPVPPCPLPSTYLLGTQDSASLGVTLRAAYTFTPELSLQFYSQLFLARIRYGPFYSAPAIPFSRVRLDGLTPTGAPMISPDTAEATLNINLVLRWEYRLGSTLFVVYTHNQNPALVPSPGGAGFQLRPIWQGRAAEDFVMVKLAYWWG